MYIDTRTYDNMMSSIIDYLSVSPNQLSTLFHKLNALCRNDVYFDGARFSDEIDLFLQKRIYDKQIDEILLFHLGRRLNSADDDFVGHNLYTLLTTETKVANFLREHGIRFIKSENHLEIVYQNEPVSLENTEQRGVCYLRNRLGYTTDRVDYCFNGFALKDLIYKNNYARALFRGPEFISQLSCFLKCPNLSSDYFDNSTYYCYEYCLPMNMVVFDKRDSLNSKEKQQYLLNQIMARLFEYEITLNPKYLFDNDNPVIRLKDDDTALDKFYCSRNRITNEMLV